MLTLLRAGHYRLCAWPSGLDNHCRMMIVVGIVYFPMRLLLVPKTRNKRSLEKREFLVVDIELQDLEFQFSLRQFLLLLFILVIDHDRSRVNEQAKLAMKIEFPSL